MGSIQTEITRIANAKTAIRTAINNKGGTVSDTALIDTYASAIDNLSTGGGTFAYAVVECDESFSSELETMYGISVPALINYSGLRLVIANPEVSTNHSFSKIDTFEEIDFEDYKDFETGFTLISGTAFIPKPNHFYAIEIKKDIIQW